MDGAETPKKAVKKSVNRANGCYRMCKCSLIVKYGTGKSGRVSTENLYMAAMVKFWPRCPRTLVLYLLNLRACPRVFAFRSPAKSGYP